MKGEKKTILTVGVILAVLAVFMCFRLRGKEEERYETRPTVEVETPQRQSIILYTDLTGQVEPLSKAHIMPKMGGEVLEVCVQAGDRVEKGAVICRIDSDALTSLKLQVDAASVSYRNAQKTLNRIKALYAAGDVSTETMEQAEDAEESARIALESAKTQYELQLEYTTVLAPIAGVVESRSVEPHDHVNTETEVCVISGSDELQINFGITEKILQNIALGDVVKIEKNGTEYKGTVTEIGTMVNSATGLYDVKAQVSNSEGLTTGSRVKLTVVLDQAENVLTIPVDVVSYDNGTPFVYCNENGVAVKTIVESGIYDSQRMEIKSGLTENSQVIVTWSNELADQEEILVEEEQTVWTETAAKTDHTTGNEAGENEWLN